MKEYLEAKITEYYKEMQESYGISGSVISIEENENSILIKFEEDGEDKELLIYLSGYDTPSSIFYIWMEETNNI